MPPKKSCIDGKCNLPPPIKRDPKKALGSPPIMIADAKKK